MFGKSIAIVLALGVMARRAHGAEGVADFARHHSVGGSQTRADRKLGDLEALGADHRVRHVDMRLARLARFAQPKHVLVGVHAENPLQFGGLHVEVHERVPEMGSLELGDDRLEALGPFGVIPAGAVFEEPGMVRQAGVHSGIIPMSL